jgi:CRISPR/Cas system CSM-associated protein Csm4 (group 5 of RAMP superfamily)
MNFFAEYWQLIAAFMAGVLGSALSISYFFYFMRWKRRKEYRSQFPASNAHAHHLDAAGNDNSQLKEIKKELLFIRQNLEEAKKEISGLRHESNRSVKTNRVVEFEVKNKTEVRFFSIPSKNGMFPEEKASQEENENTWYKIEYQKNSSQGKLYYLAGKSDKRALNQIDLFLKPVCDLENPGLTNPQKIQVLKPGKVELKDGRWVVGEKIKLRLS